MGVKMLTEVRMRADLKKRTDEKLLKDLDKLNDKTNWKDVLKGLFALALIILLACAIAFGLSFDKKVNKPEYKEHVEFNQFLDGIKDNPFTITIDGKEHTVTIGEVNGN